MSKKIILCVVLLLVSSLAPSSAKRKKTAKKAALLAKEKEAALELYPQVQKMLDKLAKKNIIHWKKAANLKSGAMLYISKL